MKTPRLVLKPGTANASKIKPIMWEVVLPDAIIVTNGFGTYNNLNKEFRAHGVVDHCKDEYVRGVIHTNNIEDFLAIMKRGIIGIYHSVSISTYTAIAVRSVIVTTLEKKLV